MSEETRERIEELARDYAATRVGTGPFLVNALLEEKERLERALAEAKKYLGPVSLSIVEDLASPEGAK